MDHEPLDTADIKVNAARASLRARLGALEDRVTDTLESTRETVTSTMDETAAKVRGIVDTTGDTLQTALDVTGCVRGHPWQATGMAFFPGVVAGILSRGVKLPQIDVAETAKSVASTASTLASNPVPRGWNPIRDLMDLARREFMTIGQQAITNLSKTVQDNVQSLAENVMPTGDRAKGQNRILQTNGRHSMN